MQAIRSDSWSRGGRAAVVIALHIGLIYVFATSVGIVKPPIVTEPMQAVMIEAPQQTQPPKPVVKPQLEEPTLEIPTPDRVPIPEIEVPSDIPAPAAISVQTSPAVESTELAVTKRVNPIYPPQSRQMGEEGVVIFRVLVNENGRPLDIQVMKSSGFSRLDDSAQQALRRWIFAPAMREGQPVRSWSRVQVKFQLH